MSIHADWACAWVLVVGYLDHRSLPDVLHGVDVACQAGPKKVRLLLKEATCGPQGFSELLPAAMSLAEIHGVRLIAQTRRPSKRIWYRGVSSDTFMSPLAVLPQGQP